LLGWRPEADVADKRTGDIADLRYLEANSVRCSAGSLSDFRVCTEDSQPLGNVAGVLISPTTRRFQYFVVESSGLLKHRRFLVPVDAGASLQEEFNTLRITARKDELDLETFTPSSVPAFSDEDLIMTMFAQDAA
jgi:PRC-barrel domain